MCFLRSLAVALAWFSISLLANVPIQGQGNAKPDIRGVIKTATVNNDGKGVLGFILVEGPKGQTYDKASIRVTKETKIFNIEGKDRKGATFNDLKVGTYVEAKFVGPVAESYPVQARAGEIVILLSEKKKAHRSNE